MNVGELWVIDLNISVAIDFSRDTYSGHRFVVCKRSADMEFSENVYVYGLQIKVLNWNHEVIFCFKHMVFIFCGINIPKC